jgi:dTMP kinase
MPRTKLFSETKENFLSLNLIWFSFKIKIENLNTENKIKWMGLFIVFDGLDGSGCETQSKLLKDSLEKKNFQVEYLSYPKYSDPIGEMIKNFLHRRENLPKDIVFLLFALDQLEDKEKILRAIKDRKFVVSARYFTSNLAYQTVNGFPLKKALSFAEIVEMPKPDLVFFLDVPPEIGIKRKKGEKETLDRYESDLDFQKNVVENYKKLIREKIFAKEWIILNGNRPIEVVAKDVQKIVLERIK